MAIKKYRSSRLSVISRKGHVKGFMLRKHLCTLVKLRNFSYISDVNETSLRDSSQDTRGSDFRRQPSIGSESGGEGGGGSEGKHSCSQLIQDHGLWPRTERRRRRRRGEPLVGDIL